MNKLLIFSALFTSFQSASALRMISSSTDVTNCETELEALREKKPPLPYGEGTLPNVIVHTDHIFPQANNKTWAGSFKWGDSDHNFVATITLSNLASLASSGDSIFEFGTFRGINTFHMAENSPSGVTVYTLDRNASIMDDNAAHQKYPEYALGEVFLNAPDDIRNKIVQLTGDSTKVDLTKYHGQMNFVFVDGGHSETVCFHDTMNALKMIKPGGYVLWDDYGDYWPGVPKCLEKIEKTQEMQNMLRNGAVLHMGGGYAYFKSNC